MLMLCSFTAVADNLPGDVNVDGEVNILDVDRIIDAILNSNNVQACDVNGDTEVNILDVDSVINVILGIHVVSNHDYVDLGLPSGTLWATCNVGASTPEEFGDYFAWGETEPKEFYSWETYKWCDGSWNSMRKYCIMSSFGMVDNKVELDPEDDAAYVNWGPSWRMPTWEQLEELYENCSSEQTTRNGVKGHLVTGPNGKTMFLPATGYFADDSPNSVGGMGNYWSLSFNYGHNCNAVSLGFQIFEEGSDILNIVGMFGRCYGLSVRAVRVPQN